MEREIFSVLFFIKRSKTLKTGKYLCVWNSIRFTKTWNWRKRLSPHVP